MQGGRQIKRWPDEQKPLIRSGHAPGEMDEGNMKRNAFYWVTILVIVSMLTASCAKKPCQGTPDEDGNTPPQESAERAIIAQAVAAGAVVGGGIGAAVGSAVDRDGKGVLIGACVGLVVGGLAGLFVAEKQIENLRDIKLENDQLEALLEKAEEYNREIVAFNEQLRQDIDDLKCKNQKERKELAGQKQEELEAYQKNLAARISEREKLVATLIPEQQEPYMETLRALVKEKEELDKMIKDLNKMSGNVII